MDHTLMIENQGLFSPDEIDSVFLSLLAPLPPGGVVVVSLIRWARNDREMERSSTKRRHLAALVSTMTKPPTVSPLSEQTKKRGY